MTREEREQLFIELVADRFEEEGFNPRATRYRNPHNNIEQDPSIQDLVAAVGKCFAYLFDRDSVYYSSVLRSLFSTTLQGRGSTDKYGRGTIAFTQHLLNTNYGVSIVPHRNSNYPNNSIYSPLITAKGTDSISFTILVYDVDDQEIQRGYPIDYTWLVVSS